MRYINTITITITIMYCFYFLVQSSSKPGPALEAEKVAGVVSCSVSLANIMFSKTKIVRDDDLSYSRSQSFFNIWPQSVYNFECCLPWPRLKHLGKCFTFSTVVLSTALYNTCNSTYPFVLYLITFAVDII